MQQKPGVTQNIPGGLCAMWIIDSRISTFVEYSELYVYILS